MTACRVLFVDDERDVLDALRDRLRRLRHRWQMRFALSGRLALEAMEQEPFDVVVSDMLMPEMSGIELLGFVRDAHPEAARLILSGHAGAEAMLRSRAVAHQFLPKPSEVGALEAVIDGLCALKAALHDDAVRSAVWRMPSLPCLPEVRQELLGALAGERAPSNERLLDIVRRDVAIAAWVLQTANSPSFCLARPTARLDRAVAYVGPSTLLELAREGQLFAGVVQESCRAELAAIQRHALLVAEIASRLGLDDVSPQDAFTAGLLHDIGKLLLICALPERAVRLAEDAAARGDSFHAAEVRAGGVDHAEAGACLLSLRGLPAPLVDAIRHHHAPPGVSGEGAGLRLAVWVADRLANELTQEEQAPDWEALARSGSTLGAKLATWRQVAVECAECMERTV